MYYSLEVTCKTLTATDLELLLWWNARLKMNRLRASEEQQAIICSMILCPGLEMKSSLLIWTIVDSGLKLVISLIFKNFLSDNLQK